MRKLTIILVSAFGLFVLPCKIISIEDANYEDRPRFKIKTKTANYSFDIAGGGFSRIIDHDGIDWINYKGDPHAFALYHASGCYSGIPNMVSRFEDDGAGHPGFDQCVSEKEGNIINRTKSKNGKWQCSCFF